MNLEYANIYMALLDDPNAAIQYLNIEYEKRPKNIDVNRMLAKSYLQLNQLKKAKQHLTLAQVTNSKHPDLIELRSNLL